MLNTGLVTLQTFKYQLVISPRRIKQLKGKPLSLALTFHMGTMRYSIGVSPYTSKSSIS